jgi:hypothetical protein
MAHPWCQIFMTRHKLNEAEVIRGSGVVAVFEGPIARKVQVPRAVDIHHRHGREGPLLTDPQWFVSACNDQLAWLAKNIEEAQRLGLILS